MLIKGLLAGIWLILVPLALGGSLSAGYVMMFALMECMAVPAIFLRGSLHGLAWLYGVTTAALGLILTGRRVLRVLREPSAAQNHVGVSRRIRTRIRTRLAGIRPAGLMAAAVILFQMGYVSQLAHMDADDSFYVAAAVTDVYTDSLFRYSPYTGSLYEVLPKRYTLSPFPVFLSCISRLSGGLHPSLLAHMILPPVFLLLLYTVLYRYGRRFFPDDPGARGSFLLVCACLMQFSGWSIYNQGDFAMIRLWQGKAVLAGVFVPLLIYYGMTVLGEMPGEGNLPLLFLANTGACLLSSMGIVLGPVTMVCVTVCAFLYRRRACVLWEGLLCCLPACVLGLLYLLVW